LKKLNLRNLALIFFVFAAPFTLAADRERIKEVGFAFVCTCGGCNHVLSVCNMVACPNSNGMKEEIGKLLDQGKTPKEVQAIFVEKYGPTVLSAPPTEGAFNLSAWAMPFVAFLVGAMAVVYFVRQFKAQTPQGAPGGRIDTSKYQQRVEEELKNYTPED
jgi:cytochrome c-type biogenesis protein CcmH